jgi:hypothetical protein
MCNPFTQCSLQSRSFFIECSNLICWTMYCCSSVTLTSFTSTILPSSGSNTFYSLRTFSSPYRNITKFLGFNLVNFKNSFPFLKYFSPREISMHQKGNKVVGNNQSFLFFTFFARLALGKSPNSATMKVLRKFGRFLIREQSAVVLSTTHFLSKSRRRQDNGILLYAKGLRG